ncbi:MAG: tripartite tricarboxylate transporter permease, partial [Acetobacterales bacterium]
MLPGLGGTAAAFLSYGVAKQASPHKQIGTGVIAGVAAPEAGNNATVGPALVPLIAFGIPGSITAALIGGALIYHGITPSPRMFELFPAAIYSLFLILLFANLVNLGVSRAFAFLYVRLAHIPKPVLVPGIIMIAIVGTFSIRNNIYDVGIMLFIGVLGFFLRRLQIPDAPLVITFLISPLAESSLRRSLLIADGSWTAALFPSALAVSLCVATVAFSVLFTRMRKHQSFLVGDTTRE